MAPYGNLVSHQSNPSAHRQDSGITAQELYIPTFPTLISPLGDCLLQPTESIRKMHSLYGGIRLIYYTELHSFPWSKWLTTGMMGCVSEMPSRTRRVAHKHKLAHSSPVLSIVHLCKSKISSKIACLYDNIVSLPQWHRNVSYAKNRKTDENQSNGGQRWIFTL